MKDNENYFINNDEENKNNKNEENYSSSIKLPDPESTKNPIYK